MFQECKISSKYLTLPCIHLTHHTPLPPSLFGRVWWVLRHRDVEKSVGATDFEAADKIAVYRVKSSFSSLF